MVEDVDATAPQHGSHERVGGSATLALGTRVGKYGILAVLGHGGFGITYRARDTQLDRDVAVKEYLPAAFAVRDPDAMVLPRATQMADDFRWGRDRFLAEAKTLARFEKAAGIVNVYDFLEANGTVYMVMELVAGETLDARLRRNGPLPQPAIEQLLYPLLDGLEQVHAVDFLHRDIKPANILIDEKGQPILIDFGASRAALQGRTQALTAVFTPGYAAFEQLTSARQGAWTDIYALGATLYHCITGAPPPSASDRMIDDRLVPAAEAGRGRYAPAFLGAVDAALKLRSSERPQSINAWRLLLSSAPQSRPAEPAGAATQRIEAPAAGKPRPGRWRWPLRLAAAILVLCLGVGGLAWWRSMQEDLAWTAVKAANTPGALQAYLDDYPSGRYAAEARAMKAELERSEDDAWSRAKAANTLSSLRGYLEKYPSGRYVTEANDLLAAIGRAPPQPRDCPQCPEMLRIPPGPFDMGAAQGEHEREGVAAENAQWELPQHKVTIGNAFLLARYEVTRGEFAAFVQATGHQTGDACWTIGADGQWAEVNGRSWRNPGFAQTDRDPVVCVNWEDAKAYLAWLKRLTGKNYRLPSEAEWEYAARAGTTAARYWGGWQQDACRHANVDDSSHGCRDGYVNTAPVGKLRANQFGLYDMLGNVWEWTEDCWNESYAGAPADGSSWQRGACHLRVLRGGSWIEDPRQTRAAQRHKDRLGLRLYDVGFRVARSN